MPATPSTLPAGNEPAALVNAVLGNIIGIFITPLWLSHFLSVEGAAPYASVLIELTYTIIGPLIVGQLMQYLTPKLVSAVLHLCPSSSSRHQQTESFNSHKA